MLLDKLRMMAFRRPPPNRLCRFQVLRHGLTRRRQRCAEVFKALLQFGILQTCTNLRIGIKNRLHIDDMIFVGG